MKNQSQEDRCNNRKRKNKFKEERRNMIPNECKMNRKRNKIPEAKKEYIPKGKDVTRSQDQRTNISELERCNKIPRTIEEYIPMRKTQYEHRRKEEYILNGKT